MTSLFNFRRKKGTSGQLAQFWEKYNLSDVMLGSGSYAEVRMARNRKTNEKVAVKIIDKSGRSEKELRGLSSEVTIMKKLRHKNVVKLFDWYEDEDVMYLVMEYVAGGELFHKILRHDAPFTEGEARGIIRKLGEALKHCYENGIIHRDIKPQNLLLTTRDEGEELKLTDFNLSIQLDSNTINFSVVQTMCGTPNYVAPEVLSGKPYDYKCDIWSLGVICFLLLSGGYLPFFVDEEGEQGRENLLQKIKTGRWGFNPPEAWEGVSDAAKDFLRKAMEPNFQKRADYVTLLNHPWLKSNAGGDRLIDTKAIRNDYFRNQMQCASTVLRAAAKMRDIMIDTSDDEARSPAAKKLSVRNNSSMLLGDDM